MAANSHPVSSPTQQKTNTPPNTTRNATPLEETDVCPITLVPFVDIPEKDRIILPCLHKFDKNALVQAWELQETRVYKCPLCRTVVSPKDVGITLKKRRKKRKTYADEDDENDDDNLYDDDDDDDLVDPSEFEINDDIDDDDIPIYDDVLSDNELEIVADATDTMIHNAEAAPVPNNLSQIHMTTANNINADGAVIMDDADDDFVVNDDDDEFAALDPNAEYIPSSDDESMSTSSSSITDIEDD